MIQKNSHRHPRIDLLRGVAVLCVLIVHFALAYGLEDSPLGTLLFPGLLQTITGNGNYGVTIFFVISGYLITATALARWGSLGRIEIGAFYLYRCARLMPTLLLALVLSGALACLGAPF